MTTTSVQRQKRVRISLGLLLVLVSCSPYESSSNEKVKPSQAPFAAVVQRTILNPLASAWKTGDPSGVTKLLHPEITESDRLEVLAPLSAKDFDLTSLTLKTDHKGEADDEMESVDVEGGYRIRGLPNEYLFNGDLTVKKAEGRWLIGALLWDLSPAWAAPGQFVRTETPAAIIFHSAGFPAAELGGLASTALASITAVGTRDKRYLVVAPGDSQGFFAVGGHGGAIAAVLAGYRWSGKFDVTAPVMIVNAEAYRREDAARRKTIILHEMTHLILARETVPYVPVWFSEGLAMYYSKDIPLEALENNPLNNSELTLPRLTSQFELGAHDIGGLRAPVEYAYSAAAVAFMMERFGEKRVLGLLSAYQDIDPDRVDKTFQGSGAGADQLAMRDLGVEVTNELFPKHLSMTVEELDRLVRAWIKAK